MNESNISNPSEVSKVKNISDKKATGQHHKDLCLNLTMDEATLRIVIALVGPMLLFLIDKRIVIYTIPVVAYLFITAMTRYCVVKYWWRHYLKHLPAIKRRDYGLDINYPEESL